MATPLQFLINLAFLLLFSTTASTLLLPSPHFPLLSSLHSTTWRGGPITIFAPSDSSLLACGNSSSSFCSLPLLLPKHSVHGYFPFRRLCTIPFATRIQTLDPDRSLIITGFTTPNRNSTKIFITLVEITHPDLFHDGLVLVHGLRGRITYRSPLPCSIQRLLFRFLSPPPPKDASIVLRLLSEEATQRLRLSGFSMVADALGLGVAGNADGGGLSVAGPTSGFESTADYEDRHGL